MLAFALVPFLCILPVIVFRTRAGVLLHGRLFDTRSFVLPRVTQVLPKTSRFLRRPLGSAGVLYSERVAQPSRQRWQRAEDDYWNGLQSLPYLK